MNCKYKYFLFSFIQPESTVNIMFIQRKVYPVCLVISSFFLILTLVVHCIIRELREDLLSKNFMCSIAMLAAAQILLVTTPWAYAYAPSFIESPACVLLGEFVWRVFSTREREGEGLESV